MSEEKKKIVKKPKSKARKIVEWVLTGLFVALFIFVGTFARLQAYEDVGKRWKRSHSYFATQVITAAVLPSSPLNWIGWNVVSYM